MKEASKITYDAAAERTWERLRDELQKLIYNGFKS